MKERVVYFLTLSLLVMTDLLVSAHSQNDGAALLNSSDYQTGLAASLISALNKITVQPGPVKVRQGNNASLWCKLEYDSEKAVPVFWQSPPNFKSRTSNCDAYKQPHGQQKYGVSCSNISRQLAFYNITIADVKWADRGEYRCFHINRKGIVDLKVLVPVTDVTLTEEFRKILDARNPSVINSVLTCETNCAFPAPNISWFDSNQPYKGRASVTNTDVGCTGVTEGQRQTKSTITVLGTYKNKQEHIISCVAENVVGEEKISRTIDINHNRSSADGSPSPPQAVMTGNNIAVVVPTAVAVIIVFIVFGIAITFIRRKQEKKSRSAMLEANKNMLERLVNDYRNANYSEMHDPERTDPFHEKNAGDLLMTASEIGALNSLHAALQDGADVNAVNQDGSTALMIASERGKLNVVKALFEAGADVNTVNKDGSTALMIASKGGKLDVVKELFKAGADVNTVNKANFTARTIARENGHSLVAEYLSKCENGETVVNEDIKEGQSSQRPGASGSSTSIEMSSVNQPPNMEPLLSEEETTSV